LRRTAARQDGSLGGILARNASHRRAEGGVGQDEDGRDKIAPTMQVPIAGASSYPLGWPLRASAKLRGETLEKVRVQFETSDRTITEISREVGVTPQTLARYVRRFGWVRGKSSVAVSDPKGTLCPGVGLCPARTMTHRRLFETLSDRIARIQADGGEGSAPERERGVRTLGVLTRMFEKLVAMDRVIQLDAAGEPVREGLAPLARSTAEEIAPYDVEELRRELSRELDKLVAARRT